VALEFEEDAFHDILEDNFTILHNLIRRMAKRTLAVRRQIPSGTYLAPLEGVLRVPNRPLNLVERIVLVRRPGSPFESASLEAISQLARQTPEVRFDAGQTLWKSGDRSEYALILISGTVSCTTQWGISRFRAGPGQPLGNVERLSGEPRWFTAVAETPVVAMRSDTEALLDILEDHFGMALSLVRAMAENLIRIRREQAGVPDAPALSLTQS
jgi:CRP-like cAMP-binding protein